MVRRAERCHLVEGGLRNGHPRAVLGLGFGFAFHGSKAFELGFRVLTLERR